MWGTFFSYRLDGAVFGVLDPPLPLKGAECVVINAVASVPASVIIIMPLDVASDLKSGFKNPIAKIVKKILPIY